MRPKRKCSCNTKSKCVHLLALSIALGEYKEDNSTETNITDLVQSKERKSNKSGSKRWRSVDKEINRQKFLDEILIDSSSEEELTVIDNMKISQRKVDINLSPDLTPPQNQINVDELFRKNFIEHSKIILKDPWSIIKLQSSSHSKSEYSSKIEKDYPWRKTKLTTELFKDMFESLENDKYISVELMDDMSHFLILKECYQDIFGYLSCFSLDNLLKNRKDLLYRKVYSNSLLSKNVIFVLVHTDILDHPTKRHFILCIICIYSKTIIIMDPLADGHNLIDYASTFLAILNLTKLIYSTFNFKIR